RRVDGPGSNDVESTRLLRVFQSKASSNGVQTTFSDHGKASGYASDWIVDQRGADAHDAAAALLCLHLFDRKLRDVNEACEIGRDESAKVVCSVFSERLH